VLEAWIVNYRSADLVAKCIDSLDGQPVDRFVILDNSNDPSEQIALRELERIHENIRVMSAPSNIGFGRGMNYISRLVEGEPEDVVWLLNPDTRYLRGSVTDAFEAVRDRKIGILSPILVTDDASSERLWFGGGTVSPSKGQCIHLGFGGEVPPLESKFVSSEYITGAAPMLRRDTFFMLGGFWDDIFLYWEDVDFSLMARSRGAELSVFHGLQLSHDEGKSSGRGAGHSITYYYHVSRNRVIVSRAHGGSALGILFGAGLRETARLFWAAVSSERDKRARKLLASVRGTIEGSLVRVSMRTPWSTTDTRAVGLS
jgi:N-acetylglucosaminyl-diphospho-decaprenol L-rhamnosyltransferase